MPLNEEQREAQDKQVGKCLAEIEKVQIDPDAMSVIKQIVRRRMRFLAENVAEA